MKWLLLTAAYHQHAQNVAGALFEHEALGMWCGGLVFGPSFVEQCRSVLPQCVCGSIDRRVVRGVPFAKVQAKRRWEFLRLTAHRLRLGATVEDLLWERGEYALDDQGARLIREQFDGVVGFEHGCLRTLQAARELKRPSMVIFASVHHTMREKWVDPEYAREKEWSDPSEGELTRRAAARDRRRDMEAETADQVMANSEFTKKSLVQGGIAPDKIVAVPLGLPPPQPENVGARAAASDGRLRVLCVGTVALHKGFHYLQRAVQALGCAHLQLDVYGAIRVRKEALAVHDNIRFHGTVRADRLAKAYNEADVLVFPTLCDGFGQVVAEALAWGLPVICSENAGVADFIRDGQNGFRLAAANVTALREALERCLDEREALAAMRTAARQTARDWSWSHFRKAWYEALEEVGRTA